MMTFANAALLAEYLRKADRAHSFAVYDGKSERWPEWFAHYIEAKLHGDQNPAVNANLRTNWTPIWVEDVKAVNDE